MNLVLAHDGASVSLLAVARRILNRQSARVSLYQLGRALGESVKTLRAALAPLGPAGLAAIAYRGRFQHHIVASDELIGVWKNILIPAAEAPSGLRACLAALGALSLEALRADVHYGQFMAVDSHASKVEVVTTLLGRLLSDREEFEAYQRRRVRELEKSEAALFDAFAAGPVRISTLLAEMATAVERWDILQRLCSLLLVRMRCVESDSQLLIIAEKYSPAAHIRLLSPSIEENTETLAECLAPAVKATLRAIEGKWFPAPQWYQGNLAQRRLSVEGKTPARREDSESARRRRGDTTTQDLRRFLEAWIVCLGRSWIDLEIVRSLEVALYQVGGKWWPIPYRTPCSSLVDRGLALGLLKEREGRVAATALAPLWVSGKTNQLPGIGLSWGRNTDRLTLVLDESWRAVTDELLRRVGFTPGPSGASLDRTTIERGNVREEHLDNVLSAFWRLSPRQAARLKSWSVQSRARRVEQAQLLHKTHPVARAIASLACPWPVARTQDHLVFVGATPGRFRAWLAKIQLPITHEDGAAQ